MLSYLYPMNFLDWGNFFKMVAIAPTPLRIFFGMNEKTEKSDFVGKNTQVHKDLTKNVR